MLAYGAWCIREKPVRILDGGGLGGQVASLGVSTVISYNSLSTDPRASGTIEMGSYDIVLPGNVLRPLMKK